MLATDSINLAGMRRSIDQMAQGPCWLRPPAQVVSARLASTPNEKMTRRNPLGW